MIWWIIGIAAALAISKSSTSSNPTQAKPAPASGFKLYGGPDIKSIGPFTSGTGDYPVLPGPAISAPQASTTLTDYQTNLAAAFNTYSQIYGKRSITGEAAAPPVGSGTSGGGSGGYGGAGSGGAGTGGAGGGHYFTQ